MIPAELTAWRKRLGLTKGDAAKALGLSPNGYGAYERGYLINRRMAKRGERGTTSDGAVAKPHERGWIEEEQSRPIPLHVELACERLEQLATATAHP